jgi:L-ascorbate metabolism protein UlaG (beta-lactamase superfamily)
MSILTATVLAFGLSWLSSGLEVDQEDIEEGEAVIWYLGHSGWAVETENRFLIFDYWERREPEAPRSLSNGHIDPEEISDKSVIVFVTHSHADHYDPRILDWEEKLADVTYVFGWKVDGASNHIQCGEKRETIELDGVTIRTIHHDFDGVPESAFLVELDGIVLYHSGDHGNGPPPFKDEFVSNIDYVAKSAPEIDFAFIPLWGEESYVIDKLKPKVTFPMHDLGRELKYKDLEKTVSRDDLPTTPIAAEAQGARFHYRNGGVTR